MMRSPLACTLSFRLLIVDGHEGLRKALAAWPQAKIQRCAVHKLRNLLEHCPVHARPEVQRDFHRIIHAKDGLAARAAYDAFGKKWSALCAPVAASLEEAGLDLLTYYDFPKSMWKSLRTTNAIAEDREGDAQAHAARPAG